MENQMGMSKEILERWGNGGMILLEGAEQFQYGIGVIYTRVT